MAHIKREPLENLRKALTYEYIELHKQIVIRKFTEEENFKLLNLQAQIDLLNDLLSYPELPAPLGVDKIDISSIRNFAVDYVKFRLSDKYHEDHEYENYAFEKMIQSVYGKDIFQILEKIKPS